MTNISRIRCLSGVVATVLLMTLGQEAHASGFSVFSSGYTVPETISQAPAGFGSLAGSYLVPDGTGNRIQVAPPSGGPSSTFATMNYYPVGGLFLPASYGTQGGQFLTVGFDANSNSYINYFNQSGTLTGSLSMGSSLFATPLLAPSSFGTVGGQVLISDEFYGIHALSSSGTLSNFVSLPSISPFGMAFAPAGFGNQGGQLLVSDVNSGLILSVNSDGQVSTFADLHLNPGQVGLRQMGFIPDGFGSLSGLLLVSVSGSQQGRGTLGSLLGLDSSGDVVASLKIGTNVNAFDPRGFDFLQDGSILVSDSSQPGDILILTQANFSGGVPEPSSWILCGIGFVGFFAFQWRQAARRRRCHTGRPTDGIGWLRNGRVLQEGKKGHH